MNAVLEHLGVLQVSFDWSNRSPTLFVPSSLQTVVSKDTGELLLCVAYISLKSANPHWAEPNQLLIVCANKFLFLLGLSLSLLLLRLLSFLSLWAPKKRNHYEQARTSSGFSCAVWWFYIDILQHHYHDSRLLSFSPSPSSPSSSSSLLRFEHVVVFSIHWLAACISTCSFTAAALFTFL